MEFDKKNPPNEIRLPSEKTLLKREAVSLRRQIRKCNALLQKRMQVSALKDELHRLMHEVNARSTY